LHACMYACMYVRMYVCTYVCTYVSFSSMSCWTNFILNRCSRAYSPHVSAPRTWGFVIQKQGPCKWPADHKIVYPDNGSNDFDYVFAVHGHHPLHNQHRYLQDRCTGTRSPNVKYHFLENGLFQGVDCCWNIEMYCSGIVRLIWSPGRLISMWRAAMQCIKRLSAYNGL
jgi:hypothetical protein